MIKIKRITVISAIATNCYIVWSEGRTDAVVVDPGAEYEKIVRVLHENGLTAKAVLLTHAHYDHCNAAARFQKDGCTVYLHSSDVYLLESGENLARRHGIEFENFRPDVLLEDGTVINECGMTFTTLHTPGHTGGSVCFVTENTIFSGDTLFYMTVGRTDFATGSQSSLIASVRNKLFALDGDYTVCPGHGDITTLDFERKYNPYV